MNMLNNILDMAEVSILWEAISQLAWTTKATVVFGIAIQGEVLDHVLRERLPQVGYLLSAAIEGTFALGRRFPASMCVHENLIPER
jgi:hypothetical protein